MEKIRSLSRTIVSPEWNMKVLCPMLPNSRTDTGVVRKVVAAIVPMEGVAAPEWAAESLESMTSSSSRSISDQRRRPCADKEMAGEEAEAADEEAMFGREEGRQKLLQP